MITNLDFWQLYDNGEINPKTYQYKRNIPEDSREAKEIEITAFESNNKYYLRIVPTYNDYSLERGRKTYRMSGKTSAYIKEFDNKYQANNYFKKVVSGMEKCNESISNIAENSKKCKKEIAKKHISENKANRNPAKLHEITPKNKNKIIGEKKPRGDKMKKKLMEKIRGIMGKGNRNMTSVKTQAVVPPVYQRAVEEEEENAKHTEKMWDEKMKEADGIVLGAPGTGKKINKKPYTEKLSLDEGLFDEPYDDDDDWDDDDEIEYTGIFTLRDKYNQKLYTTESELNKLRGDKENYFWASREISDIENGRVNYGGTLKYYDVKDGITSYDNSIDGESAARDFTRLINSFKSKNESFGRKRESRNNRPAPHKKLKEEYGEYRGEYFCDVIADYIEDDYWRGEVDDIWWELDVNGYHSSDFHCPQFREEVCRNISYPVKDGHLSYMGLDFLIDAINLEGFNEDYLRHDLELFDFDEDEIEEIVSSAKRGDHYDIEFWADYDTNFDVDAWEEAQEDEDDEDLNEARLTEERPPRVRTMSVSEGERIDIHQYPNFSVTGSITGMRKQHYGDKAYLVRCGSYIYNVPEDVYYQAH